MGVEGFRVGRRARPRPARPESAGGLAGRRIVVLALRARDAAPPGVGFALADRRLRSPQPRESGEVGRLRVGRRPPPTASGRGSRKPASWRLISLNEHSGAPRVGSGRSPRCSASTSSSALSGVDVVEELVVDGDDRREVAGRQALGVLEGDGAVLGGLVVVRRRAARDSRAKTSSPPRIWQDRLVQTRPGTRRSGAACTSCRRSRPRRPRPWSARAPRRRRRCPAGVT